MNDKLPTSVDQSSQPSGHPFIGVENDLSATGLYALAYWFDTSQKTGLAVEFYEKALQKRPEFAEAHYNLAVIHNAALDRHRAEEHLAAAIRLQPGLAPCYSLLGMIRCDQDRFEEALALLQQAVAIDADFTEAHFNMGLVLQQVGRYQDGLQCFRRALACNPAFAPARWLSLLSLPMVYDTRRQIETIRQQFSANLHGLVADIRLETGPQIQYALQGIHTSTNFYLQYQGCNDLELQSKYGGLVHAAMTARYPHWGRRPAMPEVGPGEKIRIGYVSSFMRDHTVGTFLSGWLENHDRDRFELHGFHVGGKCDAVTRHLSGLCHHFYHIPGDVAAAAQQIAAQRLHILVFTDIGMNTETLQLAALRLAPVQCKGWGHPVTTGLPTMDYYLTSDRMEPDNARAHYSETLVRLPNLALCYTPAPLPDPPPDPLTVRQSLGIPTNRFVYLSPQSIFKYLPQHDDIYPLIARRVPRACFVFLRHQSQAATDRFRRRLQAAFGRYDLDAGQFCHFSPRLDFAGFLSLNLAADVLLDTFEWSGGKTTLEALGCGLPVVTFPGRFMRGRHAYAMLDMMGMTETIAGDPAQYCDIAVRLAHDRDFLTQCRQKVAERRHRLYHDRVFMCALEDWYRSVVRHRLGRSMGATGSDGSPAP